MKSFEFYDPIGCEGCSFAPICASAKEIPEINNVVERHISAKKGDNICRPNQKFHSYYVVHSGILKSYSTRANSKEYITNFYFHGDIIGLEAFYKMKYESTVDAITHASMCSVPSHSIDNVINYKPELYRHILGLASKEINSKTYLNYLNADQRLAGYLLDLISRINIVDNIIKLPITQLEIANHLNLTPETVNRVLHRWESDGIIARMHNKQFILPDITLLNELCW